MALNQRKPSRDAGKGRAGRAFAKLAGTAVLVAGLAFSPAIKTTPSGPTVSLVGEAKASIPGRARNYKTTDDPFVMDSKLKAISASVPSGSTKAKTSWIFKKLKSSGIKALHMTGKAPRTAAQALKSGGDCTDLANIFISIAQKHKLPGGVMLVHFNSAPANLDHLVPYVKMGGRKVIVDLQTTSIGKTAQGSYKLLMDVPFSKAGWMYHREMGNFFKMKGKRGKALNAFLSAVKINPKDAYVHQNVAMLYVKRRDFIKAVKHMKLAAKLDPKYRKQAALFVYNVERMLGTKAYNERRFADCAKHFTAALNSGHRIPRSHRALLRQNIGVCKSKAR